MKSSLKYGLSRPGWKEQEGSGFNLFMENRKRPHDKINELRTGKINAPQRGGHCPELTGTSHSRVMGKTPNQFRHRGAKGPILTTCIQLWQQVRFPPHITQHTSALIWPGMYFVYWFQGSDKSKNFTSQIGFCQEKKTSNNLIITVT